MLVNGRNQFSSLLSLLISFPIPSFHIYINKYSDISEFSYYSNFPFSLVRMLLFFFNKDFTMKQAIVITGTPGTGKTTLSKLLSEEGYSFIEVGKLVKEEKLYDYFDEETDSYVVNDDLLNARLIELIAENSSSNPLILDGHVVELPPSYVTCCIVLRCSIGLLRQS